MTYFILLEIFYECVGCYMREGAYVMSYVI